MGPEGPPEAPKKILRPKGSPKKIFRNEGAPEQLPMVQESPKKIFFFSLALLGTYWLCVFSRDEATL